MQNYLLATGDLNHSIQESFNLAVSNGRLNDGTAVQHEPDLNPTTDFFKQDNNPFDVAYIYIYIYKAKFDIQNPIIRSLLEQIDTKSFRESA